MMPEVQESQAQVNGHAPESQVRVSPTAYEMWRADLVARWLLAQRPSELTRACLRGVLPRLDPLVADQVVLTVTEQLAALALAESHAAEAKLKSEEAAEQRQKAAAASSVPREFIEATD